MACALGSTRDILCREETTVSLINDLALKLSDAAYEGHTFDCLPIRGEVEVLQVQVSELDALPIYVTATETQILCISYLFRKGELLESRLAELNESLLEMSLPMPLSAFAIVDDFYVIYGALSPLSILENVLKELVTLARNANDCFQAFEEYLK
nr:YjfI family protein [Hahella sp. HN01]